MVNGKASYTNIWEDMHYSSQLLYVPYVTLVVAKFLQLSTSSAMAVSYTHLDVYKRQHLYCVLVVVLLEATALV